MFVKPERLRLRIRMLPLLVVALVLTAAFSMVVPPALGSDSLAMTRVDDNGAPESREPFFGQDRTTGKFIPEDADFVPAAGDRGESHPLVVLLHGYTMSVRAIIDRVSLLEAASDRGWFVIVPSGLTDSLDHPYWNATPACCDRNRRGNDDVAYLRQVITNTLQRYPIDRNRVIAVGLSNGAFMAYQLACHASDLFAGVVALAGTETIDRTECPPKRPVSVLAIHGTRDRAVFFKGGDWGVVPEIYAPYPSAWETVHRWADRNGCPTAEATGVEVSSGTAGIWENCEGDSIVRFHWVPQGHNLWIGPQMIQEIVDFIATQSRPPGQIR